MKKQTTREFASVGLLIAAAVAYRVIFGERGSTSSWMPNFSPMAAIVLCGAVYLPIWLGLLLPTAILLISDVILNLHFGAPLFEASMLVRYVSLGALAGLGLWLRSDPKPVQILMASLAGSI